MRLTKDDLNGGGVGINGNGNGVDINNNKNDMGSICTTYDISTS